jgi:hypothetical protein
MRGTISVILLTGCTTDPGLPAIEFACETFACVEAPSTPPTLGDPAAGLEVMLNGDLMKCGVPLPQFESLLPLLGEVTLLPGRTGDAANVP